MPNVSFAEDNVDWQKVIDAVIRNSADLPHLAAQREQLQAVLKRAMALQTKQTRLQSQVMETTRELRETVAEGRDLASRIRAGFKQVYGGRSTKLGEVEGPPRRRPRRKAAAAPTAKPGPEEIPS